MMLKKLLRRTLLRPTSPAMPAVHYGGVWRCRFGLDIELHDGAVVAVWWRNQLLPFDQRLVGRQRALSMLGQRNHPPIIDIDLLTVETP